MIENHRKLDRKSEIIQTHQKNTQRENVLGLFTFHIKISSKAQYQTHCFIKTQ